MTQEINDGGWAFPRPYSEDKFNDEQLMSQSGMTLRQWYAGLAMQSLIVGVVSVGGVFGKGDKPDSNDLISKVAHEIADSMIQQGEKS